MMLARKRSSKKGVAQMNVKITNNVTGQVIETTWRPVGKRSDNSSARGILSNIRVAERADYTVEIDGVVVRTAAACTAAKKEMGDVINGYRIGAYPKF